MNLMKLNNLWVCMCMCVPACVCVRVCVCVCACVVFQTACSCTYIIHITLFNVTALCTGLRCIAVVIRSTMCMIGI